MKKAMFIFLLTLVACGPTEEEKKEIENKKEIEAIENELNSAISMRKTLDLDTNVTVVDSLKTLLSFKRGEITDKEFNSYLDSIAELRRIESFNWQTGVGGNPVDGEWKFAVTTNSSRTFLKLEQHDERIWFLFEGTYFCDDYPRVDIALKVNDVDKIYKVRGEKASRSKAIIVSKNFLKEEYLEDFKNAEEIYIRVNESHCTSERLNISMSGVQRAIDFFKDIN